MDCERDSICLLTRDPRVSQRLRSGVALAGFILNQPEKQVALQTKEDS